MGLAIGIMRITTSTIVVRGVGGVIVTAAGVVRGIVFGGIGGVRAAFFVGIRGISGIGWVGFVVAAAGVLGVGGIGIVVSGAVVEFFVGDHHSGHPGLLFGGEGGDLEQFRLDDAVGGIVGVENGVDEAAARGIGEVCRECGEGGEGTFRGAIGAAFAMPFDFDATCGLGGACWGFGPGGLAEEHGSCGEQKGMHPSEVFGWTFRVYGVVHGFCGFGDISRYLLPAGVAVGLGCPGV